MEELLRHLETAQKMVEKFYEAGKDLPTEMYFAAVAMMVEERCKSDGTDAREKFKILYDSSVQIFDEMGKY